MSRSLSKGATPRRFEDHPTEPVTPVHNPIALVAIARNRWSSSIGTTGRHQSEQVVAITRCAQTVAKWAADRAKMTRSGPWLFAIRLKAAFLAEEMRGPSDQGVWRDRQSASGVEISDSRDAIAQDTRRHAEVCCEGR
jgi:hypothetical protein